MDLNAIRDRRIRLYESGWTSDELEIVPQHVFRRSRASYCVEQLCDADREELLPLPPQVEDLELLARKRETRLQCLMKTSIRQAEEDRAIFPSVEELLILVAHFYQIERRDLLGPRRTAHVIRPRQVAMYLVSKTTSLSITQIGRQFRKDHTTVLHAVSRITERMSADPELADEVQYLINVVREWYPVLKSYARDVVEQPLWVEDARR